MIFSQMKSVREESTTHWYQFITYRDRKSNGVSKHSRSWRVLIERNPTRYMSFNLEFIYE